MTPAPISVDRLRELLAFLDGSGQLDGRSFGDDGPIINGIRRNYWWRADLRHIAALLHQLAEMSADLEREQGVREDAQRQLRAAERAREEACGLLRDVIAWRRTFPIAETPNRKDGGIFGRIAAFLAASGGK